MKRREFLQRSAGLAGALVPGLAMAQTRPCPPPSVAVTGGTTASSSCSPLDADADWKARSAGALMATRFDTLEEVTRYRLLDGKHVDISWDAARKCSGAGSMKFIVRSNEGQVACNWFRHLSDAFGTKGFEDPNGTTGSFNTASDTGFNEGSVFEVSYRLYVPASMRNRIWLGGGGWKTAIISHDRGSNQSFEIVHQNSAQRGYPHGYTQNPPNTLGWDVSFYGAGCTAWPDYKHQPAINRGANPLTGNNPDTGQPWTACQQEWAQYGGTYGYGASGYPDTIPGTRIWKYWERMGTAQKPIGPVLYPADNWIALKTTVHLNSYTQATNRVQVYAARREHTDWQLVADLQNRLLPTSDNGGGYKIRYNCLWLTPFNTGKQAEPGGPDSFLNYDEIIVKSGAGSIACPQYWP